MSPLFRLVPNARSQSRSAKRNPGRRAHGLYPPAVRRTDLWCLLPSNGRRSYGPRPTASDRWVAQSPATSAASHADQLPARLEMFRQSASIFARNYLNCQLFCGFWGDSQGTVDHAQIVRTAVLDALYLDQRTCRESLRFGSQPHQGIGLLQRHEVGRTVPG